MLSAVVRWQRPLSCTYDQSMRRGKLLKVRNNEELPFQRCIAINWRGASTLALHHPLAVSRNFCGCSAPYKPPIPCGESNDRSAPILIKKLRRCTHQRSSRKAPFQAVLHAKTSRVSRRGRQATSRRSDTIWCTYLVAGTDICRCRAVFAEELDVGDPCPRARKVLADAR